MKLKRFDLGTVKDIALELVYPYHCRLKRAFKHGIHHMDMGRKVRSAMEANMAAQ